MLSCSLERASPVQALPQPGSVAMEREPEPVDAADLQLDDTALSAATVADRGELYLLNWLSTAERTLELLPDDALRRVQATTEATLVRLVTVIASPPAPAPRPGRPARQLIARCLVTLFRRGETRSLFDVVQSLVRVMGDLRADNSVRVCVGGALG